MSTPCSLPAAIGLSALALAVARPAVGQGPEWPAPNVLVVNMIPRTLSDESNQDSEPNIAVNPAHPRHMAGSAFTPDPFNGAKAPIYVTRDGGRTWALNSILPGSVGTETGTFDITLRFGTHTNVLYAGILRAPDVHLNILRTANFLSPAPMTLLVDRPSVDQPYVAAATEAGKDRVFIGDNDFASPGGKTATVDRSIDAAAAPAPAGFGVGRLEERPTGGQDGPQVRFALHPSGVIYGVFVTWHSFNGSVAVADYVVVRDDQNGAGPDLFKDLKGADGKAGLIVAANVNIPWSMPGLGQERTGGDPALAVDPRDHRVVYLAYQDRVGLDDYTLHVRRSTDSGATWSSDLLTITDAKNPSLAINDKGVLGLVYQQLAGKGANQRWVTHLTRTRDAFVYSHDLVLATVPGDNPTRKFFPYIGDYLHLMAVGDDFCGVFCASNIPDRANFPSGVRFQRNANFQTKTLLGTNGTSTVAVSIDPYFFRVSE
jgi:hypothetical protein